MKKIMLFLIFVIYSCTSSSNLIIPGKGVGSINIATTMDDIFINKSREEYLKNGLLFNFENGNKLKAIIISSMKYKTKEGFTIGSLKKDIRDYYGDKQAETLSISKGEQYFPTDADILNYNGISFVFKNNKVIAIIIS